MNSFRGEALQQTLSDITTVRQRLEQMESLLASASFTLTQAIKFDRLYGKSFTQLEKLIRQDCSDETSFL